MRRALLYGGAIGLAVVSILTASQDNIIYIKRAYESHGMKQYYDRVRESFEDKAQRVLLEVSYNTSMGQQTAFWIPPRVEMVEKKEMGRLWLVFGGNAQLALDWLWFISRLSQDFYADSFLLMDYPGYGKCKGSITGSTTVTESVKSATERVLSMIRENDTDPVPRVAVLAHSLGCAAGLNYALVAEHHIEKFVLVSPFASIPKMAMSLFLPSSAREFEISSKIFTSLITPRNRWDNINVVEELGERMVREKRASEFVVIHGTDDEICPFAQGLEVLQIAKKNEKAFITKFIPVEGGDHNGIIETAMPQIIRQMKSKL